MALIIYPATNSDSFVTVPQADLYISMLTMNSQDWVALTPTDKEILLRIAYRDIIDHTVPAKYPKPLPACVGEAQALMAVHDTVNSISSGVATTTVQGAIKKQKVGTIEQQFYDAKTTSSKRSLTRVPAGAKKCLEGIGYIFKAKTTGLSQTILGRR